MHLWYQKKKISKPSMTMEFHMTLWYFVRIDDLGNGAEEGQQKKVATIKPILIWLDFLC